MIANKDYALIKAIKNRCKCNKKDAGLTGNLVDDWVTVVTQGEYTKYEDVPLGVAGPNNGWTKRPDGYYEVGAASNASFLILNGQPGGYEINENALYQKQIS